MILVQAIEIKAITCFAGPRQRRLDTGALSVLVEGHNQLPWLIALHHGIDVGAPLVVAEARQ